MKQESVLTVLMFLFKYHMGDSCELDTDAGELVTQLEEVGFAKDTIYQAFDWLSSLNDQHLESITPPSNSSLRIFSEYERELFDEECQRFVITLEQLGILTPATREMVIHQLLMFENEEIDISLVKWVTLIVLFNQPEEDNALAAMEFLVLDTTEGGIH